MVSAGPAIVLPIAVTNNEVWGEQKGGGRGGEECVHHQSTAPTTRRTVGGVALNTRRPSFSPTRRLQQKSALIQVARLQMIDKEGPFFNADDIDRSSNFPESQPGNPSIPRPVAPV